MSEEPGQHPGDEPVRVELVFAVTTRDGARTEIYVPHIDLTSKDGQLAFRSAEIIPDFIVCGRQAGKSTTPDPPKRERLLFAVSGEMLRGDAEEFYMQVVSEAPEDGA